ncbi:MAG: hypothetical protein ABIN18_23120 [Pseudomonadota bacterium]
MTLKKDLNHVADHYLSEIVSILDFVRTTEKYFTRKQSRKIKNINKDHVKKGLEDLIGFLEQIDETKKFTTSPPIKSKSLAQFLFQKLMPMAHKKFLNEMTLTYLISYQEAFIKDYLFQILISRKTMLKSGANITYKELLNYNSMKALKEALAQKEVDGVGYGSIDDTCDYFSKRFDIDLSEFTNWTWLRETTYRRNLIVHNQGITDDLYCRKTGFELKGKDVETDIDYVVKSGETIMEFILYVHSSVLKKLRLEKQKN